MKRYISLIVVLCIAVVIQAQSTNTLSGIVVDEKGNAIESVVVSWLTLPDSTLIVNGISDSTGHFSLHSPKSVPDSSVAVLTCIGYSRCVVAADVKNRGNLRVVLQEISHHIEGVTVTAKSTLKGVAGGYAFTPGGVDLLLPDGNELLKNVPMLSGEGGSYRLLGKKDAKVYINGKNPYMEPSMIRDLLANVKPSDIERVELIFNPGSSQSASDTDGILNIVLKRRPDFGFRGSVYLWANNQNKHISNEDALNLTYSRGRFRVTGSVSFMERNYYTTTESEYDYLDTQANAVNFLASKDKSYAPHIGALVSYDLTQKSTFGVRLMEDMNISKISNFTHSKTMDASNNVSEVRSNRICRTPFSTKTNATLYYYYKTDKIGGGLDISLDYNNSNTPTRDTMMYVGAEESVKGYTPFLQNTGMNINAWQVSAKYRKNFSDNSGLSFGARWNTTRTDKDFLRADLLNGVFVRDDGQSNRFVYDEMVSALFVSYERPWNKMLTTSFGVRGEHTHIQGDLRTTHEVNRNNYLNILPNVSLNLTLAGGKHILGLDYSSYLLRPSYAHLNPFKTWISANTYRVGNPDLQAFCMHSMDFRYTLFGKYTLSVSGMLAPNSFADFTTSDGQNNTVISYRSFGRLRALYTKLSGQQSFLNGHLRVSANAEACYYNYKINVQNVESIKQGWQFTGYEMVNAYFGKYYNTGITAMHMWNSRHVEPSRVDNANHHLSVSAWTNFSWNGQLSLSYTLNFPSEITHTFDLPNYHYVSRMRGEGSKISISYYQTFGKKKVKEARGHSGNSFSGRM